MKFIHLADLHIGKRISGYDLLEEQKDALDQVLKMADENQVDGVLIAGDVYDTTSPSAEAVNLLNGFLNELYQRHLPVFIISGNHDSAVRLDFGRTLMEPSGVHISGVYKGHIPFTDLEKDGEKVRIHMLPFIKPGHVARELDTEVSSWNEAFDLALDKAHLDPDACNILLAHQFFNGGKLSDSEDYYVGSLQEISTKALEPFQYAALGHLHGPQHVNEERFRYSGTLLKYSLAEAKQKKSVTLIETQPDHSVSIKELPIHLKRDLVVLKGKFDELVSPEFASQQDPENFFAIQLTDEKEVFQALDRLRRIYPRILNLEYQHLDHSHSLDEYSKASAKKATPEEIFSDFFELQTGHELDEEDRNIIMESWRNIHEAD